MANRRPHHGRDTLRRQPRRLLAFLTFSLLVAMALPLMLCSAALAQAAEQRPQLLPAAGWQGRGLELVGLEGDQRVAVAFPEREARALTYHSSDKLAAGLYRVNLRLLPAHTGDAMALQGGLKVLAAGREIADFPGAYFARVHQGEDRSFDILLARPGPLEFTLKAYVDPQAAQLSATKVDLAKGGPTLGETSADADLEGISVDLSLDRQQSFYYVVDSARCQLTALSQYGLVRDLSIDKIRYLPGAPLQGRVTVDAIGPSADRSAATLVLLLERGLQEQSELKRIALPAGPASRAIEFELTLPKEELGAALIARLLGPDGQASQSQTCFNIAADGNRVAIFDRGPGFGQHSGFAESFARLTAHYANSIEVFAWAQEDMLEMSPQDDWWFSGQTNYHMNKQAVQEMIRQAHERGVSVISYAKFIMSGYLGWKTAYDFPLDHRSQYFYPVGMWEGVNTAILDRFRNHEFVPYAERPRVEGRPFDVWWQTFLPINPDATPRMTRLAAEEIVRSLQMFGWDGIRWDGHPGGSSQGGGSGARPIRDTRRAQSLVRYGKDIIAASGLPCSHGYNYLFAQQKPDSAWARQDFELDELCRGGGLLMNESIGNATNGWSFAQIADNLALEGDLCRERGGYLLGISYARSPRDILLETCLWFAAGCRPMGGTAEHALLNRYATRFSCYTFDERLRRLPAVARFASLTGASSVSWDRFVYQTPLVAGRCQLVFNLLNLPLDARRPKDENAAFEWGMLPGSDPVGLKLNLPAGCTITASHQVNPFTLAVTPLPRQDNVLELPAVAVWQVAVVDLQVSDPAAAPAALYGPAPTLNVPRPAAAAADVAAADPGPVVLDPAADLAAVHQAWAKLQPSPQTSAEQAQLDQLPPDQRQAALLKIRAKNPAKNYLEGWWKGGSLPADLELQSQPPTFAQLTPRRDGVLDVFYGRSPLAERLGVAPVLAGFPRFQLHDAPLGGIFRAGGGQHLSGNFKPEQLPSYDLLLYAGIPHCAVGVENSYALVDYVKAGGAVLFTGGEYAFGKGGYQYTVLERELLPVICLETVDTRYLQAPLPLEKGPHFSELNLPEGAFPDPNSTQSAPAGSFWVYNQVALRADPSVKVFLVSGQRPLLVGWQLGKGRVACLLLDHRGQSDAAVTAYFDSPAWPQLLRGVIRWLAPDAWADQPAPAKAINPARLQQSLQELEAGNIADMLAGAGEEQLPGLDGDAPAAANKPAASPVRAQRLTLIRQALAADQAQVAAVLVQQLTVAGLPWELRCRIIDLVRRHPPADLAAVSAACFASADSDVRGSGYQLLALADAPELARELARPADAAEVDPGRRLRHLALALALYRRPDARDWAARQVAAWNELEQKTMLAWTKGKGFSPAAPEHPCLDAHALLLRFAALAYLARLDPDQWGPAFSKQWLMTAQYEDYCNRSTNNLYSNNMNAADKQRAAVLSAEWAQFRNVFSRARQLTTEQMHELLRSHQAAAGAGLEQVHFVAETRQAINLLGLLPPEDSRQILEKLRNHRVSDLAEFAQHRQ